MTDVRLFLVLRVQVRILSNRNHFALQLSNYVHMNEKGSQA